MGVQNIKNFLIDDSNFGAAENSIFPRAYTGSSGTGTPSPNSPKGLRVIQVRFLASLVCRISHLQWQKLRLEGLTIGTLQVSKPQDGH